MSENFWPKDFGLVDINDPRSIIEEQANILSKLTDEKALALVNSVVVNPLDINYYEEYAFKYEFYITGKTLPSYKFRVFIISYNLPVYPLKISINMEIAKELGLTEKSMDYKRSWLVKNEEDLKDTIISILNSKKIKEVVSSIIKFT